MNAEIITGDAATVLRTLPDGVARCCVTSPPYWGLRDYGIETQLGLERTPEEYVDKLVGIFREVRRVLADDGTAWLNLGDSYAANQRGSGGEPNSPTLTGGRQTIFHGQRFTTETQFNSGLKPKDLVGIPWRVAFALQADGWYLRSDIIWAKPNPMPESVTDRPTKAHEYVFLLSKRERYYYDAGAIAEPATDPETLLGKRRPSIEPFYIHTGDNGAGRIRASLHKQAARETRNRRSVWTVATQPYPEAHFATFPEALVEPCILAGSAPGDVVLDPFCGSGTTGAVALRNRRNFIGIELNPAYVELAEKRIGAVAPLFATVNVAPPVLEDPA